MDSILRVQKMADGGYVVTLVGGPHYMECAPVFASTLIDEALEYIRSKFEPAKQ